MMDESDFSESLPDPRAMLEQAIAGMPDVARLVHAYYEGLLAEGFNQRQALVLTESYQRTFFAQIMGGTSDGRSDT